MSLLTSLVFLLMSFIGYTNDKKILNPLFLMPFIWGSIILLFNIIPHSLYPLQSQFLFSVLIWVTSFMLICYLSSFISIGKNSNFSIYNKFLFNIYFYVVVIFAPIALILLVSEAIKVGPEYFFMRLRAINTGQDENETFSLGPVGYIFNFTNTVCLIFTYYYHKVSKIKYYTVLFFAFLLGLVTLARTSLVALSLGIFVILYFKNILTKKHYLTFITVFISFLFLVTALRGSNPYDDKVSFTDTFSLYLFGGMPAYDTVTYFESTQLGSYTFRFFYVFANAFGGSYKVQETIFDYAYIPIPTNVYTVMLPFYKDFGYTGVGIFGIIYGFIFGIVYKLSAQKNIIMILIYSMILPCLLLQFFGEYIFLNLSTYLQYIIIILIPKFLKFSS